MAKENPECQHMKEIQLIKITLAVSILFILQSEC